MNTKTLTAVALLLAAIPAATFAQSATTPARPTPPVLDFAAADTDGSGGISAEEWSAYATTLRDARRAEMTAARADALIAAADANGDGALTRDELVTGMTTLGDERRDQMRERLAMREDGERGERGQRWGHGERREMRGHGDGERMRGHGDGQGEGRMGQMRERMQQRMGGEGHGPRGERGGMGFARIDADGNGQISTEELAHAQEMINWMASRPQRG